MFQSFQPLKERLAFDRRLTRAINKPNRKPIPAYNIPIRERIYHNKYSETFVRKYLSNTKKGK